MKKNETSQLLAEIRNLASIDIDKRIDRPIKKNTEIHDILADIKSDILKLALEEQEFHDAKQKTIEMHNKQLKHLQDLAEQQRIQQQINEHVKSISIPETPQPVPPPVIVQHINLSTQMIDVIQLQKITNHKLIKNITVPITVATFILSLIFFYLTSTPIEESPKSKIIFNKPIATAISNQINNMWPEYVWLDTYHNVSPDHPDLTLKNLLDISLKDTLKINRDNAEITRVNKTKTKVVKVKKIKKLQLDIDINKRDY